jgi:hypothetical protein
MDGYPNSWEATAMIPVDMGSPKYAGDKPRMPAAILRLPMPTLSGTTG